MEETKDVGFLDEMAGQGTNVFGTRDVKLPFIKIITKGCAESDEDSPGYVKGCKNGVFLNTLTKEILGPKIEVVVLHYELEWLCWAPDRGGFKGRHKPGTIEVIGTPFDEGGMRDMEGNSVVETMTYYVMLKDRLQDGIHMLALTSSAMPYAQAWNSFILMTKLDSGKRAPLFGSFWELELKYNQNPKGVWFTIGANKIPAINRTRFITKEEWDMAISPSRQIVLSGQAKVDYAQITDTAGRPRVNTENPDY